MIKNAIHIENFSKSFGSLKAVNNLSFDVNKGEIFAFLGSNGSGKTTTIRCLLKIYQPDTGELLINGQPYLLSYFLMNHSDFGSGNKLENENFDIRIQLS